MIKDLNVFICCFFVSISITYCFQNMPDDQIKDPNMVRKNENHDKNDYNLADKFIALEEEFVTRLSLLTSGRIKLKKNSHVAYIYNPLEYAAELHNKFLRKYCTSSKKVLFLGMNPGPWGMCQTGVPFGEVSAVKEYLKISGEVKEPEKFHPARRVEGLNCKRTEISGKRLWELIKNLTENDPSVFFKDCFVYNYCPLALLGETGINITPADLKSDDQITLNSVCDDYLLKVLKLLDVEIVVAIGRFVEKRTLEVLKKHDVKNIRVFEIPHPSPRSKGSNNWSENTIEILKEYGLIQYLQKRIPTV